MIGIPSSWRMSDAYTHAISFLLSSAAIAMSSEGKGTEFSSSTGKADDPRRPILPCRLVSIFPPGRRRHRAVITNCRS